jgi:hypothetical protein
MVKSSLVQVYISRPNYFSNRPLVDKTVKSRSSQNSLISIFTLADIAKIPKKSKFSKDGY